MAGGIIMNSIEKVFDDYTSKFVTEQHNQSGYVDKYYHSYFVRNEALLIDEIFTRYNPDFKKILEIESLFHDIGRFQQLKLIGNFFDSDLFNKYPKIDDHGILGAIIMKNKLLKELFPDDRIYDEEITAVIKLHSRNKNELLEWVKKEYIDIFKDYSLKEILTSDKTTSERTALTAINTAIIQDVDRLDIFRKIVNGIWIPSATDDEIDSSIWENFQNNQMPSINELRNKGLWNPNIGHLVRMSFINQMNLVPELQKIKDENLIEKVYQLSGNEIVRPAYDYAIEKINELIEQSEDKILVKRK